ncbi:hypothetical protein M3F63_00910 [Brachybacterium muris]|nr:hypothetical protein [Brachybacterium muris]MCT2176239.1 hypothetical protein [Brachybacterium muris]
MTTTHPTPEPVHTDRPAFTVYPLRFSDDAPAVIAFLRTLGMAPVVTTEGEGFAELIAGGGGRVMVHATSNAETAAPAGETQLCLSVPATDAAAEQLREQGLQVRVWDETYGRQGSVRGPHGEDISLNEHQRDLYGYVGHDGARADPRLSVTAVRVSAEGPDRDGDREFFAALGFRPVGRETSGGRRSAAPAPAPSACTPPAGPMTALHAPPAPSSGTWPWCAWASRPPRTSISWRRA